MLVSNFMSAQSMNTTRIDFAAMGGEYALTIQDDGVGFPEEMDLDRISSLGLRLVRILTEQLQGTSNLIRAAGERVLSSDSRCPYRKRCS